MIGAGVRVGTGENAAKGVGVFTGPKYKVGKGVRVSAGILLPGSEQPAAVSRTAAAHKQKRIRNKTFFFIFPTANSGKKFTFYYIVYPAVSENIAFPVPAGSFPRIGMACILHKNIIECWFLQAFICRRLKRRYRSKMIMRNIVMT